MFFLACGTAQAIAPVGDDLWDISQGAVVDKFSHIVPGNNAGNMFGDSSGLVEPGYTLFADDFEAGYPHFIEWHTPVLINLKGFNLFAVYDFDYDQEHKSYARSFKEFRLNYYNGSDWINFYTRASIPPYGVVDSGENELALEVRDLAINAQSFQAVFVQYGGTYWASGPRILELDGFGTYLYPVPIPEPGTLLLLGTGLLGLLGLRRKRS